jgi:hypothetical protein
MERFLFHTFSEHRFRNATNRSSMRIHNELAMTARKKRNEKKMVDIVNSLLANMARVTTQT